MSIRVGPFPYNSAVGKIADYVSRGDFFPKALLLFYNKFLGKILKALETSEKYNYFWKTFYEYEHVHENLITKTFESIFITLLSNFTNFKDIYIECSGLVFVHIWAN